MTIALSNRRYSIIYADPPWSYWAGGKRNAARHYACMNIEEILALPVRDIAEPDCALFLWATYPMLPDCIETIRRWGFKYSTVAFTWVKTTRSQLRWHYGLGNWTRANPELVLLGIRGKVQRVSRSVPNLVIGSVGRHSAKPDEVRQRIVRLLGDLPRIELFARQRIDGWDAWGNEI